MLKKKPPGQKYHVRLLQSLATHLNFTVPQIEQLLASPRISSVFSRWVFETQSLTLSTTLHFTQSEVAFDESIALVWSLRYAQGAPRLPLPELQGAESQFLDLTLLACLRLLRASSDTGVFKSKNGGDNGVIRAAMVFFLLRKDLHGPIGRNTYVRELMRDWQNASRLPPLKDEIALLDVQREPATSFESASTSVQEAPTTTSCVDCDAMGQGVPIWPSPVDGSDRPAKRARVAPDASTATGLPNATTGAVLPEVSPNHQSTSPGPPFSLISALSKLVEEHQRNARDVEVETLRARTAALQDEVDDTVRERDEAEMGKRRAQKLAEQADLQRLMAERRQMKADQAKKEVEKAKSEVEKAGVEVEKARAEAEKTRDKAEKAKIAAEIEKGETLWAMRDALNGKLDAEAREKDIRERFEALVKYQRGGLAKFGYGEYSTDV